MTLTEQEREIRQLKLENVQLQREYIRLKNMEGSMNDIQKDYWILMSENVRLRRRIECLEAERER